MAEARFTVTVDGQEYHIVPETFVEGAVRRQAEFAYLGEEDLKSRPDTREFLHNSWIGGAQWEKPLYGRNNANTYFESGDLSFTDRAGAVQQSAELQPLDSNLDTPSAKLIAWSEDGTDGAITFAWNGSAWQWYKWIKTANSWVAQASRTTAHLETNVCMAASAGPGGLVYALMKEGDISWYDPTANTNGNVTTRKAEGAVLNGANIWADSDFVWLYSGGGIFNYAIADSYVQVRIVNDDDGIDVYARSSDFTGKPVIPEWSCIRAIPTSEGIFYVKNVFEGGLPIAKVYRVDRDASGSYILTPIGTLPKGQVAINIAHHLGSILISTVPNYHRAVVNADDQKVTVYHVTGKSIGAVGSPLGGTNIDESPLWFLGTHNEMLYLGGRKRLWSYDGRVGAFHTVHVESATKYTDHGSGFTAMATVEGTDGAGLLFMHTSQDGLSAAPYLELLVEDSLITTSDDTAFVTSNWFDFELPMEEKTIYEVFYDASDIRTDSTVLIQVSADGAAFATVATVLHTSDETIRQAVITPITGYKFQYKLVFSTDTVTSSAEPGRVYSVGFAAFGGEMVDVLQFTIDGKESMNLENLVQVPSDVYDLMAALRDSKEEIVVSHTMNTYEGDDPQSNTYRVTSVTGRKDSPLDGLYEIQLVEVP